MLNDYAIEMTWMQKQLVRAFDIKYKFRQIKINDEGFENDEMNLSIAQTTINGGDLGWLSENKINIGTNSKILLRKFKNQFLEYLKV